MKLKYYITVLCFLLSNIIFSQVTFEAKVSKRKLGVNERLRVEFIMNQDGDNFTPPTFSGFNVISGPSQSVNRSWINGKSTFSKTYTYTLAPTRKGSITIKNASVEINGEIYKTIPIKIQVTNAVDKPKSEAEYKALENIHLVAEITNSSPFLNEAFTVTYKLYFKGINIDDIRDWDTPKHPDFWSQEIKTGPLRAQRGTYNGQSYDYVILKKTVLYPQKTGKLEISPTAAEVSASIPTNKFNFFGRIYEKTSISVTSPKRTINVKELPSFGRPSTFKGAVGNFDFNVVTTKKSLRASESLQAKVEVSGTGNLKLLELPQLTTPSALEVYEPERKDQIKVSATGMTGKVSDHYTIVPNYKGKYPLPVIEFSYFDPKTESYRTLKSLELIIDVIDGPTNTNAAEETISTDNSANKTPVEAARQFKFINSSPNLVKINKPIFLGSTAFWILLLVPFLAIPLVLFFAKKKRQRANDVEGNRQRKADRLAKKYLSEAKKNIANKDAFYDSLHKSLHNYLKAKLNIETSEFSKEKISDLLTNKMVSLEINDEFIGLLKSCELARFTPSDNVTIQQDYDRAAKVINAIDKQIS